MQLLHLSAARRWSGIVLLSALSAHAAAITSVSGPFSGAGTVTGIISGTNISLTESINSFSLNDGFGVQIGLSSPPGATTYAVAKTITNNTSSTWTDFFVGVGCDTSSSSPTVPRGSVDCYNTGLSLGITGAQTTSLGAISGGNGGSFSVGGLNLAPGQTLTLTFNLLTCPNCSGGDVMFQHANVAAPEPATTALIGSALLTLSLWRRLRKRS